MISIKTYSIGFIFSILLTLAAYFSVVNHLFSSSVLVFVIISLALIQFLVQIVYFLHIDNEHKPRLNLFMLVSTIAMVLVLIIGSLWIMSHLNYGHVKSPQQLIQDEAIPLPPPR